MFPTNNADGPSKQNPSSSNDTRRAIQAQVVTSHEESGELRMTLPADKHVAENVFTSPEKSKPNHGSRSGKRVTVETSSGRRHNQSRSKSRESSRKRSRSRETSRRRSRSRESSRRRRDERSPSRSRRDSPKKKTTAKYEFLTLADKGEIMCPSAQIIIRATEFDPDNKLLGCPHSEIAEMPLGFYAIVGLEKEKELFNRLYGREVNKVAGLSLQIRDTSNQDIPTHDCESNFQSANFIERINIAKQAHRNNITDVETLNKLIRLEEEQDKHNKTTFTKENSRALAERHLDMVEKAIVTNQIIYSLQLLKCELMKTLDMDVEVILKEYEELCSKFPHEPIVWVKSLDFIQYDSNVYDYERMHKAFDRCLRTVEQLAHRIFESHVGHVKDWSSFRQFHLAVYIRYLKWLLQCGQTPLVLANIQTTMEYHFGFGSIDDPLEREAALQKFWKSGHPRIGDNGGNGGMNYPEQNLEEESYEALIADIKSDVREIFGDKEMTRSEKFVAFERKMLRSDAKCKRADIRNTQAYKEAIKEDDDFKKLEVWDHVEYGSVRVFRSAVGYESLDFLQPLLELLGVKFMHSSGCFTTTEQVISEWIPRDIFASYHANFSPTPHYSESACLDVGKRILKYLINNRHEITQKSPRVLDEVLIRYMLALIEMKFQYRDRQKIYYRLRPGKMETLMNDVFQNDDEIKIILEKYPKFKLAMVAIVGDKLTTWFEMGMAEERHLKKVEKLSKTMDLPESKVFEKHAVTHVSEDCLRKYQVKLWEYLTEFAKNLDMNAGNANNSSNCLLNPQTPYQTLQIQLYSRILQARNHIVNEETAIKIRMKLAMEVLNMEEEVVEAMDKMVLHHQIKKSMGTLLRMLEDRDETEAMEGIPEFPRAKALCQALAIALDFAFLDQFSAPRQSIKEMTKRINQTCDEFDIAQTAWQRGDREKYRDRVDLHFILDTAITFFSQNNLAVIYHKYYEEVIVRASNTFSCETKYMKRLAEIYSTNRLQWMRIKNIIAARNKELKQNMETQFDIQIERRLLQNTLTTMFATMRICEKIGKGNSSMLVNNWTNSAMEIRDPTVWRLVMGVADNVSKKMVEKIFTKANDHCPWALNLQLDYVEKMPDKLKDQIDHILEVSKGHQHGAFIEDLDLLKKNEGKDGQIIRTFSGGES